jgi:DNA-binding response OmpR family regulator
LIVEPDRALRHQLAGAARLYGSVTIAATAHEALAALRAATPDLIITELNLPDAEGIEFIAQIHRTPSTHDALIMVVTQRASVRDKIAAFQVGADDYLVKPINMQQFTTRMLIVSRFRRILRR